MKLPIDDVRQALRKYNGHPYAIPAAINLIIDGLPLDELPGDPTPPKIAATQWARICDQHGSGLLPLAPGPFGGTTVVVLPKDLSPEERQAWRELEESDVIKLRSRFASLKIAFRDEAPALSTVLAAIRDSGRSNVLIVPAAFCATASEMQDLRQLAGSLEKLNVNWLPGLGGEMYKSVGDEGGD